jgi:glycosyltransferase involved in cell wall biosynthesis
MIEAVKILVSLRYRFTIEWYGLVDGQDEYVNQCINLISKYKINDYIKLLPKVKNIEDIYKQCDFFCLPSFYEGTPNVICEAIATGRPVICSDVCDNNRYVKEGINGFLFNPNDRNEIVQSISKALNVAPDEYVQMCESSRGIAEDLLDEAKFFDKYNNILTE